MSGGAPLGNQNAVKLKTIELKKEAYRQYCDYIASGLAKEGWCFEHPELTLTWETMEKYIKEDSVVFETHKKRVAETKSFALWEKKGIRGMDGEAKCETALYQMFMRNKFGWDKKESQEKDTAPQEFDQQLQVLKPTSKAE